MPIFHKYTEFRKSNLLRMSSENLDVFWKFPEFWQSQNWGIFLQKTYKNTQADARVCCRLIAEPDFRPTYDL